jgi:hypothetical protein
MLFYALKVFLFGKALAEERSGVGTGCGGVEQFLFCLKSAPLLGLEFLFQIEHFASKIFVDTDLNLVLLGQSLNLLFKLFFRNG